MSSNELLQNKAAAKIVLRQAAKEKSAGILSKEEYQSIKAEVLSKHYDEWLSERLVE